jgi:hypothetical protein
LTQNRKTVGEFVGNIFYGTLLKEMQASSLKGPLMHGGRAEEAFAGQLTLALSKAVGTAKSNPLADRMYAAMQKHFYGKLSKGGTTSPREDGPR